MQNKTKLIFIVSAGVIIIAILFLTGTIKINKGDTLSDGNNVAASTTEKTIGGVTYTGSGNLKVEQIPVDEKTSIKVPDLNRPLNFPAGSSPDFKVIIEQKIADNIKKLKNDPSLVDEWISLGINRKIAGDYQGAREAWEYAAILSPNDGVIFTDLSDLYGYYLRDNVKAEANYLKAIEKDPHFPNYYIRAANFYREVMGDLSKAKAILEKGLGAVPNDINLKQALEQINLLIANRLNGSNP